MDPRLRHRIDQLRAQLAAQTGQPPAAVGIVRAPLRVALLGAHVDHQLGAALGCALDQCVLLAFVPEPSGRVTLRSANFPGTVEFDLARLAESRPPADDWGAYAHGAATALAGAYPLSVGLTGLVAGSLPIGGLSSSAAVDVAYLLALQRVNGLDLDLAANIALAQRVEGEGLGLRTGTLDQTLILAGRVGHLTHLDFARETIEHLPHPPDRAFDLIIVHSGESRALVGSGYNERVGQCEEAARRLLEAADLPVPARPRLGLVPAEAYEAGLGALPAPLDRRARHFRDEVARVREGAGEWARGAFDRFGALMAESGRSSLEQYESGSPALASLHEVLNAAPGVWGARFCGAGFGGSAVALADPAYREQVLATIWREYARAQPELAARAQVCFAGPAAGAEVW